MNNDFSAGFARALCGLIARAFINHEDVVQPLASSANDVPNVIFVLIRRDDCGGVAIQEIGV